MEQVLRVLLMKGWVAAWSYRWGWHGQLKVVHYELSVSKKESLPKPLTIAFASDLHAGPTTHEGFFEELGKHLAHCRPDVLLLGGDYVAFDAKYAERLRKLLTRYVPPLGTYAVIGNHDIKNGRETIEAVLRDCGAQVLINRNVALPAPFDMISICGIDDPWTGNADAALTFAEAGLIKIFLTHSPDGILHLRDETFDLAFAGHTHGGQIASQDGVPLVQPTGPLSRRYLYGKFKIQGNGTMIVSRGVGCSLIPVRVNADPELVICTLNSD